LRTNIQGTHNVFEASREAGQPLINKLTHDQRAVITYGARQVGKTISTKHSASRKWNHRHDKCRTARASKPDPNSNPL
jgi:hypothetical protein